MFQRKGKFVYTAEEIDLYVHDIAKLTSLSYEDYEDIIKVMKEILQYMVDVNAKRIR